MRWLLVCLVALALLTGGGEARAGILLYNDNSINNRGQAALNSLGLGGQTTVSDVSNFNTLLTSGPWDLVVVDAPSNFPDWTPLVNYVNGGGKAIMSFWTLQTQPALAAAFGVASTSSFTTPQDVFRWDTSHPIFNNPNAVGDLTSWTDSWADDGDTLALAPMSGAIGVAGFTAAPTAGQAAIVIGNSGRTIYNGFLFDELNNPNGVNLFANEIQFLLQAQSVVPEPTSLALLGFGAAGLAGYSWRRRKQPTA